MIDRSRTGPAWASPWLLALGSLIVGGGFAEPAVALAAAPAAVQEPAGQDPGGQEPGGQEPGGQEPGGQDPGAATSGVRMFGIVVDESLPLRCFPTDNSPAYDDLLTKGQAVLLGDTYPPSFRQVFLPIGVTGYVHKNFVTERVLEGEGAGTVRTIEDGVSWRYRPQQAGEPPVGRLPANSLLYVVGEDGDWLEVRQPEQVGWVHEADVEVVDPPTPTIERAWKDMEQRHRAAATDLVEAELASVAEAAMKKERRDTLTDLRRRFLEEQRKPTAQQDHEAIEASVREFVASLPEDSSLLVDAKRLEREIGEQILMCEAIDAINTPVKPVEPSEFTTPRAPADPLAKYDAVGWVKHYPRNELGRRFAVQKGEQILFWVTCSSGRYDLDAFEGAEIGVKGTNHRPTAESLRILDAQEIEVLSPPARR